MLAQVDILLLVVFRALCVTVGYEVPEVEWVFPTEGHTGGGDFITLAGSNLAAIRTVQGVTLACKVDIEHMPARFISVSTPP